MEKDWVKIISSPYLHQLEMLKALMSEQDIEAIIINKKDSSYSFGEAELYVKHDDVLNAKLIIDKQGE